MLNSTYNFLLCVNELFGGVVVAVNRDRVAHNFSLVKFCHKAIMQASFVGDWIAFAVFVRLGSGIEYSHNFLVVALEKRYCVFYHFKFLRFLRRKER